MGLIERFEDIRAWQEARILTRAIYQMTSARAFSQDYSLRDQLRRAAVSVIANI
ncbi:MAG TPA: four helix bundle protein, partial [Candidatus Binatia bacterium]|nr:four helix bundle protein [Candidatus Binatia bacterium]